MVRSLGSSDKGVPLKPQHSAEGKGERFVDVCDAADGFRAQDLRIEWAWFVRARSSACRCPPSASLPDEALIHDFATTWFAFDGFSPDAARGTGPGERLQSGSNASAGGGGRWSGRERRSACGSPRVSPTILQPPPPTPRPTTVSKSDVGIIRPTISHPSPLPRPRSHLLPRLD